MPLDESANDPQYVQQMHMVAAMLRGEIDGVRKLGPKTLRVDINHPKHLVIEAALLRARWEGYFLRRSDVWVWKAEEEWHNPCTGIGMKYL